KTVCRDDDGRSLRAVAGGAYWPTRRALRFGAILASQRSVGAHATAFVSAENPSTRDDPRGSWRWRRIFTADARRAALAGGVQNPRAPQRDNETLARSDDRLHVQFLRLSP